MDLLFFISIGCFFALFVAALAIARHVRIEGVRRPGPEQVPALSTTSQDRIQLTLPQTEQSLHTLTEQKQPDWRFLVSETRRKASPRSSSPSRKPPASVGANRQRPDWAYANQDFGNLSDPYQLPASNETPSTGTYARGR